MFDSTGSRLNFSVVSGLAESFRVSFWVGEAPFDVSGATFAAAVFDCPGGELVAELAVEHDARAEAVLLGVPALPEGHFDWELRATDADGVPCRLLYGSLSVLSAAVWRESLPDAGADGVRELLVQQAEGALRLRWQLCSVAQAAAAAAAESAQEAALAASRAQEAALSAGDAAQGVADRVLGEVRQAVADVQAAAQGVQAAAADVQVQAGAAVEEVLALTETARRVDELWVAKFERAVWCNQNTGTWWVYDRDTGCAFAGEDGHSPRVSAQRTWLVWDAAEQAFVDTGVPLRGEPGRSPFINALGHWVRWDDAAQAWVDTETRAAGRDGLDGSATRRVVLDTVWLLPVAVQRGVFYYVHRWVAPQEPGGVSLPYESRWDALLLPPGDVSAGRFSVVAFDSLIDNAAVPCYLIVRVTVAGVTRVLGVSREPMLWAAGERVSWEFAEALQVPEGATTVGLFLSVTSEALVDDVPPPGVYMKTAYGDGQASMKFDRVWYGSRRVLALFDGPADGFNVFAPLELPDGGGEWVRVGEAPDLASEVVHGLVRLGTGRVVRGGAPVGNDADGAMAVPLADVSSPGVGRASTDKVLSAARKDGPVGLSADGAWMAERARAGQAGVVEPSRTDGMARVLGCGVIPEGTLVDGVDRSGQWGCTRASANTYGMAKVAFSLTDAAWADDLSWVASVAIRDDLQEEVEGTSDPWYRGANGQLVLPLERGGALRWFSVGTVSKDGRHWPSGGELRLVLSDSFSVSAGDGLCLEPASVSLLGGVRLAATIGSGVSGVVTGALVFEYLSAGYWRKEELYSRSESDALFLTIAEAERRYCCFDVKYHEEVLARCQRIADDAEVTCRGIAEAAEADLRRVATAAQQQCQGIASRMQAEVDSLLRKSPSIEAIEVLGLEEYRALSTVNPKTLYLLK